MTQKFKLLKQPTLRNVKVALYGLTLLFFLGMLVFVVKYFGLGPDECRTVRVQVMGKDWSETPSSANYRPQLYLNNHIRVGSMEYGADGKVLAEVIGTEMYDAGDGLFIALILKLKVNTNKRTKIVQYRSTPLANGTLIQLSLANTSVIAQVIDIDYPEAGYKNSLLEVEGRYRNIEPWLLDSIKVGDSMKDLITGDEVAIVTKKVIEPSLSQIYSTGNTYYTNTFLESNPRLKDVVITIKVKVVDINGLWFFADQQKVKVGQPLKLRFPEYDLGYIDVQNIQLLVDK